jgi:ribosomal protein S12 methylthiotransferase
MSKLKIISDKQEQPRRAVSGNDFMGRAAVVTLGCAKNHVDSEVMLGVLADAGYELTRDVSAAEVVIINTCSFLQSAVKESIDTILEISELKKKGQVRKVIVAGCLVERYKQGELTESLPEVDAFIGNDDIPRVAEVAGGQLATVLSEAARPYFIYNENTPRRVATPGSYAYVKISEGCNRPCTFCIIPKIRGAMRSRSIDSIVKEVGGLAAQGFNEMNLVAQDSTAYGTDTKAGNLAALLRALDAAQPNVWHRLMYAYPVGVDAELLNTILELPSVCNYIDIPLQHSSEAVLKSMQRPLGKFSPRKIVEFMKATAPKIDIRTTFIVGYPGETEQDVADLEHFISQGYFTNVGVFCYSPEPGTPAAEMAGQVPQKERTARRKALMAAQQQVVKRQLKALVGSTMPVLVEGPHPESDLLLQARTQFQAPEVDGTIMVNDVAHELTLNSVVTKGFGMVKITGVKGYDLVGTLTELNRVEEAA